MTARERVLHPDERSPGILDRYVVFLGDSLGGSEHYADSPDLAAVDAVDAWRRIHPEGPWPVRATVTGALDASSQFFDVEPHSDGYVARLVLELGANGLPKAPKGGS
jgi:hypothetical protein